MSYQRWVKRTCIYQSFVEEGYIGMTSIQGFIREYVRAVSQGYAAIFAGAGLSRGSGYTNWKELISPLASEIGLDVG